MAVVAAKQIQSAIQAQQAANLPGVDLLSLSTTIANVRTKGLLSLCDVPERAIPTDADEEQIEDLAIPLPAESTKYCLRLCIHSGKHFPRERVFVKLVIGEGTEKQKTLVSPTALLSPNPVWEYLVDEEVDYDGKPPNVEIMFFGERLFGAGKMLGACALPLPAGLTDGPRRQYIKVANMPTWFLSEKLDPGILVVWQVCNTSEGEPDLLRVAEMPAAATEKRKWTVDIHVACLELKRPTAGRQPILVQLECIRMEMGQKRTMKWRTPSGVSSQPPPPLGWDDGPMRSTSGTTRTTTADLPTEVMAPDCRFALWSEDVNCAWEFHDTQVNLMTAIVRATVYSVRPMSNTEDLVVMDLGRKDHWRLLGSWQETLPDLMDAVDESNTKLWFDAELKSNEGLRAGRLRMELDIYTGDQVHKSIRPTDNQPTAGVTGRLLQLARNDRVGVNPAPGPGSMEAVWGFDEASLRVGMGSAHRRTPAKQITYYCSLFADSLIVANQSCNPYVRITMTTRGDSEVISTSTGYDVIWPETVQVKAKSTERKARIEIWNKSGGWGWANDELLGEAMIYEVSPGTTYWCHCFGGAYGAAKADEAMQMVRGAIKPASTYRGSVAVHFGTRPKQATGFVRTIADMRAPVCLIVRLYRGIYLDSYRGKQVSVIVQLAGCGLPSGNPETAKNRSVLSFPGIVDNHGVLRFVPVSSDSLVELLRSQTSVKSEDVAWVERSTPMREKPGVKTGDPGSVLLRVAPGVTHAYLYIVKLGDEDLPPQVFGRLRVQERDTHHVKPVWKRMRWDCSVVDLDEASDDFAGYILGSAVIMPAEAQWSEDEIQRKSPDSIIAQAQSEAMTMVATGDTVRSSASRPSIPASFSEEDPKLPLLPFEKHQNLVVQLDPSKKSDLLPSPTKPTSVLCRPFCHGKTMVNVGSPGETVHYRLRQQPTTVYCHLDVLAARCLPSMDDDGLADPCYMIRIEDKVRKPQQEETVKSLNPTFMHRFVIPVQVELDDPEGEIYQSHSEPLPPVLFQLWDRDQHAPIEMVEHYARKMKVLSVSDTLGETGASYAKIGSVVVKHPRCLDNEKTPRRGPIIDVDSLHEAVWHAVDRPAHTPFEPETKFGIDTAWTHRPRVLLATGYSLCWNPNNPEMKTAPTVAEKFKFMDAAKKWAKFSIEIDLLGLRNLPTRMHYPELCISSFWEGGPVKLTDKDWTYKENPQNPNFRPMEESMFIVQAMQMKDMHAWEYINSIKKFVNQVRPVIPIRQVDLVTPDGWERVPELAKKKGVDPSVSKFLRGVGNFADQLNDRLLSGLAKMRRTTTTLDEFDDDENNMVQLEDVLGIRISAPVYKVPIIPYMQRQTPSIQLDAKYVTLDDEDICYPYLAYKTSKGTVDTSIVPIVAGELGGPSMVLGMHSMSFEVCYANQDDGVEVVGHVTVMKTVAEEGMKTGGEKKLPILLADGTTQVGTLTACFTSPADQVLMPELVIQLRNMYTAYEYGTLSAPLRSLVSEWDMASWSQMAIQEYKNCQLKGVKSLTNATLLEDSYDVFVDVFAAKSGHLMWNPDVRMGRFIQNQSLFRISQNEADDDNDDDADDEDKDVGRKSSSPFGSVKEPPFWQSFNPMDKVCGNPYLLSTPFDQRFMPDFVVDRGEDGRRCFEPPTPDEMLGSALRSKAAKASTWSTKMLRKEALKVRERCVSHLTVPEGREADLEVNRRTFIRLIGHQIIPEHDRDSRYLARLRISATNATETEHNNNYLVIKFNYAGTVVWAPSEEKTRFDQPGEVLFAVRLDDGSGVLVAVTIPILDIRFPFETGWYLRKTLNSRWRSLANRIESKIMKERRKHDRRRPPEESLLSRSMTNITVAGGDVQLDVVSAGKAKNAATKGVAAMQAAALTSAAAMKKPITKVHQATKTATKAITGSKAVKENKPDSDDDQTEGPDGYSNSIYVTKNAFVCRLRKRKATHAYDRLRTRNWYRTVLSDVFDEVKGLKEDPEDDLEFVRTQFFARFMNLRQALVTGESQDQQGLIKGHITVKRLPDESTAPGQLMPPAVSQKSVLGALEKAPEDVEKERSSIVDSTSGVLSTLINKVSKVGKHGNPANMPNCGMRPVENLWISSPVNVEVYVLTADSLKLKDARTKLTPYLTVSIKGDSEFSATMREAIDDLPAGARAVSFYEHFSFMPTMPGVSTLVIQVWNKTSLTGAILQGNVQHQLIGECEVDIEDRWLVLAQKQLRAISNQDYLRQQTSPLEVVDVADAKAFLEAMDKDAADPAAIATARGRASSRSSTGSTGTGAIGTMVSPRVLGMGGPAPTGPGPTLFETDKFFQLKPKLADTFGCFQRKLFHAGDVGQKKEYAKLLRSHWNLKGGKVPVPTSVLVTPDLEFQRLDVHKGNEGRPEWKAPTKPIRCDVPGTGTLITPHVAPLARLPIETKDLLKEDEDTGAVTHVGSLRFWVDLHNTDETYHPATMSGKLHEYEIRILIGDIQNISIFKDFGERNDVNVEGRLSAISNEGTAHYIVKHTDTHRWAQTVATFNWRWIYRVKAPALQCQLELIMRDEDRLSGSDLIYEPKVLNLDHMLMLAHTQDENGEPRLGVNSEKVHFDAWPKQDEKCKHEGCLCWRRKRVLPKPQKATMSIDVEILPARDADSAPVEPGRVGPEPGNRLTWKAAVQHPQRFVEVFLGPTNTRMCVNVTIYITILTFLITLFALVYLVLQTFNPLLSLR